MMRIITGRARGTKLNTLEGLNTRPTAERTKEAVFSMIQFDIPDSNVLDLFAGSGQMGLEAVSRGATRATFVDNEKSAIAVINQNVKKTHSENESHVVQSDFESYLKRVAGKEKYGVVFLDPPYASDSLIKALKCLTKYNLLAKNATVVCESGTAELFEGEAELKECFDIIKQTKYGVAHITILKPRSDEV